MIEEFEHTSQPIGDFRVFDHSSRVAQSLFETRARNLIAASMLYP